MIEFEIDGKKLKAEQGKTIIEVGDASGIYIPRFCYHKKLSIAANCRMCLVEVEKAPKPLPACATPVTAGMKVLTKSEKAIAAQRSVMEFLLINHPLDCPICDQGGECELQDLSMGYGNDVSRYNQGKRSVHDKNLGPLVESFMTRCIQCTRCVRFGEEVAGLRELGAYNRGEDLEIGTYVERAMRSELSGNVIDICPVGALTSKPFRYQARAWEMRQHSSIAPHDCLGSHIYIHTRGEEYSPVRHVMRVVPRAYEPINEVWLSDRDRFSYEALNSPDRILEPLIKQDGYWQKTDWTTALNFAVAQLKKIIKENPTQIGAVASPNSTLEELYLLQKLMRGIGSNNIDHRLQQTDFRDQEDASLYPNLGMAIEDLEKLDTILLIGSDVRREQPLACQRIRKATLQDISANVICINPIHYDFNFDVKEHWIVDQENLPLALAKLMLSLTRQESLSIEIEKRLDEFDAESHQKSIHELLNKGRRIGILLGAQALNHPQAALIKALAQRIANKCNAKIGYLTPGANAAGAWLAGAIPHREAAGKAVKKSSLNVHEMFEQGLKAYVLCNVEPELDYANSAKALAALGQANFVLCLTPFITDVMREYADVILPIAPFSETAGTFVNAEGRWQRFAAVGPSLGEVRPGWVVLRVLGNLFKLDLFDYTSHEEVHRELFGLVEKVEVKENILPLPKRFIGNKGLQRISEWHMYRTDNLVRRSKPLQDAIRSDYVAVRINPALAERLHLLDCKQVTVKQNQQQIILPLYIDKRIANNNVFIPAGVPETSGFGEIYGEVELTAA